MIIFNVYTYVSFYLGDYLSCIFIDAMKNLSIYLCIYMRMQSTYAQ